jgi:hypothetical protein
MNWGQTVSVMMKADFKGDKLYGRRVKMQNGDYKFQVRDKYLYLLLSVWNHKQWSVIDVALLDASRVTALMYISDKVRLG